MNVNDATRRKRNAERDVRDLYFQLVPVARPPAPPPPSPTFDVVPVERLTQRTDRFRCAPYRAVLTAGTCADRQSSRVNNHAPSKSSRERYECCRGCALGAQVAERVGPAPVTVRRANAERKAGER